MEQKVNSSTALAVSELIYAVQYGDFNFVKKSIEVHKYNANTTDGDNCTLLHWAAINNRTEIASYLIKHNANVNLQGGNLKETPLHWCVRNDHYTRMLKILLFEGKADPLIKSVNGCDALFVACQHGSINATFLLLHYTEANPDTINNDGDTPLYWLLKFRCRESLDLQRLLLRYHASVLYQDINENNALHIIMGLGPKADIHSALMVYEIGRKPILTTKNRLGFTPYQIGKNHGYNALLTFLEDAWYYVHFPKSFPIFLSAFLIVFIFLAAYLLGLVYSMPAIFASLFLWFKFSQSMILTRLSRQSNGFAWGIIITIVGSYYIFFMDKLPFYWCYIVTIISTVICSTLYLSAVTSPITLRDTIHNLESVRDKLAEDLTNTGYPDGPSPPPLSEQPLRPAKLCTTCLADKSQATTHCAHCNTCIISLDHHCVFVNNCVGLGNRLVFVYFTLSATFGCLLYVLLALYVEYSYYCPYIGNNSMYYVFIKEWCMLNINPSLAIVKYMSILCVIWIGAIAVGQLCMIGSETTTYESMKGSHRRSTCSCNSHSIKNIIHFFSSGGYKVDSIPMELSSYPNRTQSILSDSKVILLILTIFDKVRLSIYRIGTMLRYRLRIVSEKHSKQDEEIGLLRPPSMESFHHLDIESIKP